MSLYKKFTVNNVSGNLLSQNEWTSALTGPPSILEDERGRTVILTHRENATYLVARGSDKDFKRLTQFSGVETGGARQIILQSVISSQGGGRRHLMILEYNSERERLGEVMANVGIPSKITLRKETAYVLFALRILGRGTTVIDLVSAELIPGEIGPDAQQLEVLKPGRVYGSASTDLAVVRNDLKLARTAVSSLEATLQKVEDSYKSVSAGGGAQATVSRVDIETSAAREKLGRELLIAMAQSLPSSNGSHHYSRIPISVGIITDEYMFNFYKDVFEEVHYLSPSSYASVLAEHELDAILYVTCWRGIQDDEWKGVKFREAPKNSLQEILEFASRESIPTIFQSIEDPSNFEYFVGIAERFDWVFTSDTDSIEKYKIELGHDRVFYGEYGANPIVNNPIGSYRFDLPKAFFAGSYPERYLERCADMATIFDAVPEPDENLVILDRNFEIEGFDFPEKYRPSVLGPVPHEILQRIHKLFRYNINFNSIKNSPTMCAMRVYELQAQGKPLISNYARSIFNKFPGIRIITHETLLRGLGTSEIPWDEFSTANDLMVQLLSEKTSFDVVSSMMEKVGLPTVEQRSARILVIAPSEAVELVKEIASRQVGVATETHSLEDVTSGTVDLSIFGYAVSMNSTYDYSSQYLLSKLNAFKFTNSSFVTQGARFGNSGIIPGAIHEYTSEASDPNLTMVSLEHPDAISFATGAVSSISGAGYIADPFGVGYRGYRAEILNRRVQENTPKLSVIIPVYNNGSFLVTKCLPSLTRNRSWGDMEILLIDDGSTDGTTQDICAELAADFSNVHFFNFDDGGSGSASRPRNYGIEVAKAPLVTFLDPDNEISPGGYDNLLSEYARMVESGVSTELVSGYQVKVGSEVRFTGKHASGKAKTVKDPKRDFFDAGKFPVVSTQAAVIDKNMLRGKNIRFVEKAAGQDTLFGWEVLASALNPTFVDTAYLVYFAEREGSVTNKLDLKYFEKCLMMEEAQVSALQKMGVLESYKKYQLPNFLKNWYIPRLGQVKDSDRSAAEKILSTISELYGAKLSQFV